jgi:purine-nucleoside phosphorylase
MDESLLKDAAEAVRKHWPQAKPKFGAILGSGWSELVDTFEVIDSIAYENIPGLGKPGVEGHSGRLSLIKAAETEILIFQGRRHYYEGVGWTPIALPVHILKSMGVEGVVITNAAGGIRADLVPGTLMVIEDHINFMGDHPLIGPHRPMWGPRFPDQTEAYNRDMRAALARAAERAGEKMPGGVYLALSGPTYETPAEIKFFQVIGAHAVGMSTVPEVMLGNGAGLKMLGISCITNLAAGLGETELSHEEVYETTATVMPRMQKLFDYLWEELAQPS